MKGKIVHIEIPADDTQRAMKFWGDVTGWKFKNYGEGQEGMPEYNMFEGEPGGGLYPAREGEKGIKVTRFKGLGEMDGEELWDTTLDPSKRTLLRVQLDDAIKADEMFRILMGEKVEPRREFIQKHALEVKEIDYHGA